MINTINLRNFKLHKDTTIKFGKINVFIGPNNSGKSSIIHALQLLVKWNREELYKRSLFYIDIRDIKGWREIISAGEERLEIEIEGGVLLDSVLLPSEVEIAKKFIPNENVKVKTNFCIEKDGYVKVKDWSFEFEVFNVEEKTDEETKKPIYVISVEKELAKEGETGVFISRKDIKKIIIKEGTIVGVKGRDFFLKFQFVSPYSVDLLRDQSLPVLSETESKIVKVFRLPLLKMLLDSFHFVYPIRGLETLTYQTTDKRIMELNIDSLSIASRAQSVANAFIYNRLLEDEIYEKMKDVIDVKFYAELGEIQQEVKLMSKENDIPYLFEGLGAHQMLFMFLPIVLAKQGDTICVEEPENHLHPKAQYQLSKLFVKIVKQQRKQLILTTHSEHILFGFLNSVANGKLKKDELVIYYFENKRGEAKVKRLRVNEFGQVEGGLPGFFEVKREELVEFLSPKKE